jgi:hypothetical protein
MSLTSDGTYEYSATVLSVFWSEAEHEKLIARWPHLASEVAPPGTSIGDRSSGTARSSSRAGTR